MQGKTRKIGKQKMIHFGSLFLLFFFLPVGLKSAAIMMEKKLVAASKLIEGLGSERTRWTKVAAVPFVTFNLTWRRFCFLAWLFWPTTSVFLFRTQRIWRKRKFV